MNWLVHQGNILYSITALFSLPWYGFLSLFTSTDDSQCRTLLINQGVWERTREYLLYLPINHKIKQMRTNLLIIKPPNPNFEWWILLWYSNLECTEYPRGEESKFRSLQLGSSYNHKTLSKCLPSFKILHHLHYWQRLSHDFNFGHKIVRR